MVKDIKLANIKYVKLLVERNDDFKGELKITPNINIKSIDKIKSESTKQEFLKVDFQFGVDYSTLGKIEIEGKIFFIMDSKTIKETIDGWKDKKMDNETNLLILNVIMQKASIKALSLEEEMGLPSHIQLPRLQLGKKE